MSKLSHAVTLLSAVVVLTAQAAAPVAEHVPGEMIVKFRDAASSRAGTVLMLHTLEQRFGKGAVQNVRPLMTDPSYAVVHFEQDGTSVSALEVLQGEPSVQYAEPNYIYHTMVMPSGSSSSAGEGMPNDPDFSKQWNFHNTGQADSSGTLGLAGADINVLPLWSRGITGKKSIVVAVIDTGISWTHQDLAANLYTNPGETAGNGKDDDGNGFVDDIHGWNFVANNGKTDDDNGHGSHCAGVIGASSNNGMGVSGVNWNVSLMPVKFLDAKGSGSLDRAVDAINYARMMKVNVMSNSWGGGGTSQTMLEAIQAAKDAGILFVAAAGNDGSNNDSKASYPSSYDVSNIVAVAATDNKNAIAKFSNYGASHVHVAAPGVNIFSTYKGSAFEKNKYKSLSGTSMATPHVAGISALLLSEHPEWTPEQVKARLIQTSTPVAGLAEKVAAKGVVNAASALDAR